MGYRIIYDDEKKRNHGLRIVALSLLFFVLFLGWTFQNWEEGWESVRDVMFPGRAGDAVLVFENKLEEGQSVIDAVSAFCRTLFIETAETVY